jgi:hypothetical protein
MLYSEGYVGIHTSQVSLLSILVGLISILPQPPLQIFKWLRLAITLYKFCMLFLLSFSCKLPKAFSGSWQGINDLSHYLVPNSLVDYEVVCAA